MIRSTPCAFYIKYLIVHPDQLSNEQIQERLSELGLDDLGEYYIDKLRAKLNPPKVFYPTDRFHTRSQRFLIKEGIQTLFLLDDDALTARRILEFPRHKEFAEAMLMAYAPFEAIADALTRHRNFRCKPKAIELFKHYFWNIDLLDSVQVRALINMRGSSSAHHKNEGIKNQTAALQKAHYSDPRRLIAQLPYSPMSAVMAQMKMGLMPAKVNLAKIVERTREAAALAAYEAVCTNSSDSHQRARDFSDVVRSMTEVLEQIVRPDENLREELAQIALRTDEGSVPYIQQLSGGHHTVDLQPSVEDRSYEHFESTGERAPGQRTGSPGLGAGVQDK